MPSANAPAGRDGRASIDAELMACVLYWGVDRRIPVDRIQDVLAGLPAWLQQQQRERGTEDPMVQSLILDHLPARDAA